MILIIIIVSIIVFAIFNQNEKKHQIANETLFNGIQKNYRLLIEIVISSYDLKVCPKCQGVKMELQTVSENGQSVEYSCISCNNKIYSKVIPGKDGTKAYSKIQEIKRMLTILVKNSGNKIFYRQINNSFIVNTAVYGAKGETLQPLSPLKTATIAKLSNGTAIVKIKFPYNSDDINTIRTLKDRKYHPDDNYWSCPVTIENLKQLTSFGWSLDDFLNDLITRSKVYDSEIESITISGGKGELLPHQKIEVGWSDGNFYRTLVADVVKSPSKLDYQSRNEYVNDIDKNGASSTDIRENKHNDPLIIEVKSGSFNVSITKHESFKENRKEVPFWSKLYVYSYDTINCASKTQKEFYSYFRNKFLEGEKIDLQGNTNYAFILYYDLLNNYEKHLDVKIFEAQINLLGEICPKTKTYSFESLLSLLSNRRDSYSIIRFNTLKDMRYQFEHGFIDYDPDEFKLGEKYKGKLGLDKQEVDWLNKFNIPLNTFISKERYCIVTIKHYLLILKKLNESLNAAQTNIDKEVVILKKKYTYKLNGYTPYQREKVYSRAESDIYNAVFRRVENSVRNKLGYRGRVNENTHEITNDKFDKSIGFLLNKLISELESKIDQPVITNFNEAIDKNSKIKVPKRKQIVLDKSEISAIEQKHKLTVKLLNEYLDDDKDDVQEKIEIAESGNEEVETSFTTILN